MLPGQIKANSIGLQIRLVKVMAGFHTIVISIVQHQDEAKKRTLISYAYFATLI